MTAQPHAHVRFRRAIERRALWLAEDAARELPNLPPLEDALQLVHLYAERGSPKFERAAMRWLERYLSEGEPRLHHFAEVTADLARRVEVRPHVPTAGARLRNVVPERSTKLSAAGPPPTPGRSRPGAREGDGLPRS